MATASDRVHDAAARGFARNAADYERSRPPYPPEAMAFLADRLDLRPGRTIADVGAGTGKMTRLLVSPGAEVLAVEPVEAMRTELVAQVTEAVVIGATAAALPLAPRSVDAIVCAQAFHWFATTEVLLEFARVLKPRGALALVWNVRDKSVPWIRAFTEVLRPYEGDRPDHNSGRWREAFDWEVPFGPLETAGFVHEQPMTPEMLVSRAASTSFVGALDEPARSVLLAQVREIGEAQGEDFVMPYRSDVHVTALV